MLLTPNLPNGNAKKVICPDFFDSLTSLFRMSEKGLFFVHRLNDVGVMFVQGIALNLQRIRYLAALQ